MAKNNPQILAATRMTVTSPDIAHGTGVLVFTVSADALVRMEVGGSHVQVLAAIGVSAADRAKMFAPRDRLKSLHELIRLIIKNGSDVTHGPRRRIASGNRTRWDHRDQSVGHAAREPDGYHRHERRLDRQHQVRVESAGEIETWPQFDLSGITFTWKCGDCRRTTKW